MTLKNNIIISKKETYKYYIYLVFAAMVRGCLSALKILKEELLKILADKENGLPQ
ncbi:hypothetical protein ACNSOL_11655 (plasmid) [Aliarcobacter lanthieri]|uniref:hypothetical protein n=1 Tax=Aliarcobacter lanthieri TaxID=1355374 RepID=UPI003AAF9473